MGDHCDAMCQGGVHIGSGGGDIFTSLTYSTVCPRPSAVAQLFSISAEAVE